MLRQLDKTARGRHRVMPIPNRGLAKAINDRLSAAAAPSGENHGARSIQPSLGA